MEAVGDVGSLLAAQNEDGTEPLAPDRFDQVLHHARVVERCRRHPRGSEDVVRAPGGERALTKTVGRLWRQRPRRA